MISSATNSRKRIRIRYRGGLSKKVGSRGILITLPDCVSTFGELKCFATKYINGDTKTEDYDVKYEGNSLTDDNNNNALAVADLCDDCQITVCPVKKWLPLPPASPTVPSPEKMSSVSLKNIKLRRNQSEYFRTKDCRNWVLDKTCRYHSRCKFAHVD